MTESSQKVVALLTDFGLKGSHYVASMKGVILKVNPNVKIVDIAHEISPFSIIEASHLIRSSYKHFPKNTVFLIVVDPGVGSSREILALKTKSQYFFVAPNNGIFLTILKLEKIYECVEVKNDDFFNLPVSNTFHGRDIMAPVAAHIANGVPLNNFGPYFDLINIKKYLIEYMVDQSNKKIKCTVLYIDSFGNITLNIPIRNNFIKGTTIPIVFGDTIEFQYMNNDYLGKLKTHFGTEPMGTLMFIIGSSGLLEISKNRGSAAEEIGLKVGDIINVKIK